MGLNRSGCHSSVLASDNSYLVRRRLSFDEELRHIRRLNFIKSVSPDKGINAMPRNRDFNVKDFFEITGRGKEYLKLREESAKRSVQ